MTYTRNTARTQTHPPATLFARARRCVQRFLATAVPGISAAALVAAGTAAGHAQQYAGAGCVATIKSRSVPIDPSGAWAIPSVPVDSGKYRVRIVCPPQNGSVYGATSDYVALPPNGTVSIPQLPLVPLFEQPNHIGVVNIGQGTLGSLGATLQLQTQIFFPSGALYDGTLNTNGTTYTSSNTAVATVSADGLITATGPGTVVITAANDGLISTIQLSSFSALDSDGDGIPDAWEIANGLNPYDPTDASADPDGDGLTNLQEYLLGTNPHVADTDGDGLNDGDEVKLGTNPLLADTDGDGLSDGDEVRLGTNPLVADTDGDGIPDGIEVKLGLNPLVPDATTTVTGHVTQANGSPFQGASVSLLTYYSASTDATGAFLMTKVPVTLGNLVVAARVVVSGSVLAGSSASTAPVGGGTTDVGTIQLGQSSGQVSGVVTGASNQPVANASVTVIGGSDTRVTTTDASGAYAVVGLQAGAVAVTVFDPSTSLRGQATGMLSSSGATLTLNVKLAAYGSVSGTVLNASGGVVGAGAAVSISGSLGASTTTDSLGHYSFSFVPLGGVTVDATDAAGNRGRSGATVTATAQTISLNVQYIGRGTVAGTVYDVSKTAVAGAAVALSNGGTFGQSLSATTNSLGQYTFSNVYDGTVYVSATYAANNTAGSSTAVLSSNGQSVTADITLLGTGTLTGTVYKADGTTPVSGAAVVLGGTALTAATDASGKYTFTNVPLGAYVLLATDSSTSDRGRATTNLTTTGATVTADIKLLGMGSVTVTVVDGAGTAVSGAVVNINTNGPLASAQTAVTASDGTVTFNQQLAGTVQVNASNPVNNLAGSNTVTLAANGKATVTVSLQSAGSVQGFVYKADGATPVAGLTVVLGTQQTTTDATGAYSFTSVAVSSYTAFVEDSQKNILSQNNNVVVASQGQVVKANFVLVGRGTVTGHVTNPDGTPAANVPVTVTSARANDGNAYGTQTDVNGLDSVPGIPDGGYLVVAQEHTSTANYYGTAAGNMTGEGTTVTTDVQLSSATVPANLVLMDVNGQSYRVSARGALSTDTYFDFNEFGGDGTHVDGMALSLVANGTEVPFTGYPFGTSDLSGQQFSVSQTNVAGLNVTRKVYVPSTAYFARYIEQLTNPSSSDITVDVKLTSYLHQVVHVTGPDSALVSEYDAPKIISTSSGDTLLNAQDPTNPDHWVSIGEPTDEDPFLVFGFRCRCIAPFADVFNGPGAAFKSTTSVYVPAADASMGTLTDTYASVKVPAGGTVEILHFYAQQNSFAGANASGARLVQLPPEALTGMTAADAGAIPNFAVPAGAVSTIAALPSLTNSVAGYVYASDTSTPIAGAGVSLQGTDPLFGRIYSTSADGTGAYQFPGLSAGQAIPPENFVVSATHPLTQAVSPVFTGSFDSGATAASQNIVLSNTGILTGTVSRNQTVLNVSGAITLTGGPLTSALTYPLNTDGTYFITGLLPGTYTVVASVTNTLLTGIANGTVSAGATTTLNITIGTAGSVQGTVTRADGSFATGDTVYLRGAGSQPLQTLVDTGGRYLFTDVPTGNYTLDAYDPTANAAASASVSVATNAVTTQNLTLVSSGAVNGVITANDGSSVAGLTVTLTSVTSSGTQTLSAISDSGGNYTFNGVKPGSITLRTTTSTGLQGSATGSLPLAGQTVTINLRLLAVGSLTGTVFQGDGVTPATGIQVTLSPAPLIGSAVTTTDSSGKYSYSAVAIGGFTVYANNLSNNDQGQASSSIQANGQIRTVNITLNGFGTLIVKVVDSSNNAIANAAVTIQNQTIGTKYTGKADATGTATFTSIYAGGYQLSASDPVTGLNATQSGTLTPGATQTVTVTLASAGTITGIVYGVDGKTPASGITVAVTYGPSAVTASDGSYTLASVPLGYAQLRVTDTAGVLRNTTSLYLSKSGQVVTQNFTLIGIGTVHGTVRNVDGTVLENATLAVADQNATIGGTRTVQTGGDGTYSASGLPVGAVTVTVQNLDSTLAGYGSTTLSTDGASVQLDIQIVSSTVSLPLTLNDADGLPYGIARDGSFYAVNGYVSSTFYQADQLTLSSGGATAIFGNGGAPTTAKQILNGRQIEINQPSLVGLNVTRKIYVPTDGYFARRLDVLQNTTSAPVSVTVQLGGLERYTKNVPVYINSTSNGTATVDNTIQWLVDDDDAGAKPYPETQPAVGKIFTNTGAATTPSSVLAAINGGYSGRDYYYSITTRVTFNTITIPANSTVSFLAFDAQEAASGTAKTAAQRLVQLPAEALAGLSATDLSSIVNFNVPASPLPAVSAPATGASLYGTVYAGDGKTVIPSPSVYVESTDLYFGWGITAPSTPVGTYITSALLSTGYAAFAIDPLTNVQSVSAVGTVSSGSTQPQDIPFTGTGILSGLVTPTGKTTFSGGNAYIIWYNNGMYAGSANEAFASDGIFGFLTLPAGNAQLSVSANSPTGGAYNLTGNSGIGVGIVANQTTNLTLTTPATGSISALVKNFDGTPAPAVTVYLDTPSFQYASGITDGNGAVTFAAVPVGPYTLMASDPTTKYNTTASTTVTQDTTSNVTLSFIGKGSLAVTVKYANGGVGSGVTLQIATSTNSAYTYASDVTDGNGLYTFSNVPTGPFTVRAFYPGQSFYSSNSGTFTANSSTQPFTATLTPVGTISGTVSNADGTPASGAYVCINDAVNQFGTCPQTDNAGAYASFPVPADRTVTVLTNLPNNSTGRTIQAKAVNQQVPGDGQTLTVNLRFPGLATVHVKALKTDGTPYTSGTIGLKSADGLQNYTQNVGADGTATFTNVVEGTSTARMYVCCGSFNAGSKVFTVQPSDDGKTVEVVINTSPTGTVQGQVYAADGKTVIRDNYYVQILDIDTNTGNSTSPSDGAGYSFTGVQVGASGYQVTGQLNNGAGKTTVTGNITTEGQTDVKDLTLAVSSISGTLYLFDGVTPVPNANLYAQQGTGSSYNTYSTTTDAKGTFQLSGPVTGTVTLTASDSNDVIGTQTVTLATDTAIVAGVTIKLSAVGTVTGTVYDASGQTVPNTNVSISSSGNNGGFSTEVTTDSYGVYAATDIPVGNITVYADMPDGTTKTATGVLNNNGDAITINVGSPPAATTGVVFGTVYDSNQNPAPGATVTVTASSSNNTATATTDSNGLYTVSGFPAGDVVASAVLADGTQIDAVNGTITDVTVPTEIDLGIGDTGNVSGYVYDAAGNPITGVSIGLSSTGDTSVSYGEDVGDDGSFYFSGIASGVVTLTVTRNDTVLGTTTGTLPFGGNLTINVTLSATGNVLPRHSQVVIPPLLRRPSAPSPVLFASRASAYGASGAAH